MDNYSYNSYPDSNNSSPRCREVEFENPPPWEDPQQNSQNYKVKFMCSYGGKINPRSHDNQLAYVGGETKIFAVDRNTKFSTMISKLAAMCGDSDVSFKYQLPGEDLDALISVTNDDDLEHMMHEYDRFYRTSSKPARMRLFLFSSGSTGFGSEGSKSERDRFAEVLNSGPSHVSDSKKVAVATGNVDFLFGLERGIPPQRIPDPVAPPPPPPPPPPEYHVPDDRAIGPDRVVDPDQALHPIEIQRQLQRLQLREHGQQAQEAAMYLRKSGDNLTGIYGAGDNYVQKVPEKVPPATLPASVPQTTAYWPDKPVPGPSYPVTVTTSPGQPDQPVYMIPASGNPVYHHHAPPPQMMRPLSNQQQPMTGPPGQTYYTNVQRMSAPPGPVPDVYRDHHQVYNMVPPQHAQQSAPPPMSAGPPPTMPQMGVVRQGGSGGMPVTDAGYTQVTYDNSGGRQVYYSAPGGGMVVPPQYQGGGMGMAPARPAVSGEMRASGGGGGGGGLSQEGKVVGKVSQSSV